MKLQGRFMRNTYKLIWSDEAIEGLNNILTYLELNFALKDVKKFAQRFEKQLELIRENPEIFPLSRKSKHVRKCVMAKLTSIYYTIDVDSIKLVTIVDNRKNYKDLK
jgi:plasmid stabilization system protein ParE